MIGSRFRIDAIFAHDETLLARDESTDACVRLVRLATQRTTVFRRAIGLEQNYLESLVAVVDHDGATWLALAESAPGYEPLSDLLARRGRLEITEAVRFVLRVCGAVDALHAAGVVHGDVVISNLRVRDCDGLDPLLGFGRSGPPGCQRPESVDSKFVEADDTWGIGALLYTLLLGDLPSAWGLERGRLVGDLDDREVAGILEQALCSVEEMRTKSLPVFEAELEDWLVSKLGEGSLPQIAMTIPPPLPHYPAVATRASEFTDERRSSSRGVMISGAAIFTGAVLGFVVTLAIAERNEAVSGSAFPKEEGLSAPVVDLPAVKVSAKAGAIAPSPLARCVAEFLPNRVVTEKQSATLCTETDLETAMTAIEDARGSWSGGGGVRGAGWFHGMGHFDAPTLDTLRLGCCADPQLLTSAVFGCEHLGQAARNLARDVLAARDYSVSLKSYQAVSFCLAPRPSPGSSLDGLDGLDGQDGQVSAFSRFAQGVRKQ